MSVSIRKILPRKRKHLFVFIAIAVIWYLILNVALSMTSYCYGCNLSPANSNAKLLFTNTATYITKSGVLYGESAYNDGIYSGSLIYSADDKDEYRAYNVDDCTFDFSAADVDRFLKIVMGMENEGAGYYYVIIKDGLPVQAYWSKHKRLLRYTDDFTAQFESGTFSEKQYIGGHAVGGYPQEVTEYHLPLRTPTAIEVFYKFFDSDIVQLYILNSIPLAVMYIIYCLHFCRIESAHGSKKQTE